MRACRGPACRTRSPALNTRFLIGGPWCVPYSQPEGWITDPPMTTGLQLPYPDSGSNTVTRTAFRTVMFAASLGHQGFGMWSGRRPAADQRSGGSVHLSIPCFGRGLGLLKFCWMLAKKLCTQPNIKGFFAKIPILHSKYNAGSLAVVTSLM